MNKTKKKPALKKIYFMWLLMMFAATVHAQNISWLQGSWQGIAYVLGNEPSQNYDLLLTISKVKGKNFEGLLKTMKHTDTTLQSTSKVTGIVTDLYLVINIATWKVNCGNCKPQNLAFSFESGKFVFKGEARGCSAECTWITEFSRNLHEFNDAETNTLHELATETPTPAADTQAIVQNTPPPAPVVVTPAPPPPAPVKENVPVEKRIPVLKAGDIIKGPKINLPALKKPPANLTGNLWLKVKENAPVISKIDILPAGEIVSVKGKQALPDIAKISAALTRLPFFKVKETEPILPRTAILNAGEIIPVEKKTTFALQGPPTSLNIYKPYFIVKEIPVVIPERKVPTSIDTLVSVAVAAPVPVTPKLNTPASKPPPAAVTTAPPSLLPGYNDRKISVVKTLYVNTDSITLNVYDNGVVDGDIVSVVYNDKIIVDKLSLKSKALVVKIPVGKVGINKLVFYAHNLGEFPPNTAQLDIYYGIKKEELTISSDYTVSSAIDIVYKP